MTVELSDERLDIVLDHFGAERLLAREVIVKRALGNADALHQLLKACAVIALLHQEGHPLIQQFFPQFLDVAPAHVNRYDRSSYFASRHAHTSPG